MDIVKKDQKHCSPSMAKGSSNTCFSREFLVLIANIYNQSHQDDTIPIKKSKMALWKSIDSKMKKTCGSKESCWIEQPFIKNQTPIYSQLEKSFRPAKPLSWYENENEWLNTYDILNVMNQYQESDKSFKFVGVFPIDFAAKSDDGTCVVQQMCNLDFKQLWKEKIKKVGIIFNTDKHNQSGSHWISMFIGLNPKAKNYGIYFYDSVAMKPPKELVVFMKNSQKELIALHPKYADKLHTLVNRKRRQYSSTECGVYAMVFIISMLKQTFEFVCEHMGKDNIIETFRDVLYRPSK